MPRRLKLFVLVLVMIAVPAAMVCSQEVDKKEAKALAKAANDLNKISDDVIGPAQNFEKIAKELDKAIDKAGKDKKFTKKEIKQIKKLSKELDKIAKNLQKICNKVTKQADKLTDIIEDQTEDS